MKFTRVLIENFLTIGEADFTLDGLGLVHVSGKSDETAADSNGAGKSSVGDAIAWCLWGETARGVGGDEVVNTYFGENCMVQITIDDAGDTYRISRYRKHKRSKNLNRLMVERLDDQGAWVNLTKGTNPLTQKVVERILGCNAEVFNAANYSGQEMMPDIPNMTDKQLKTLVEQASGIDVLTNAYQVARDRMREKSEKRAEAQLHLDATLQRYRDAKASEERLTQDKDAWEVTQKSKIAKLETDTRDAIKEYKEADAQLDRATEQTLTDKISEVEAKIAAVQSERDRENVLAQDASKAEQQLKVVQTRLAQAETALVAANSAVSKAETALKDVEAGEGKPCSECTRPLEREHLAGAIKRAQLRLDAQKQDRDKCIEELGKLKSAEKLATQAVDKTARDLKTHQASMTNISAETQYLRNLNTELQIHRRHVQEVERLKTLAVNLGDQWKREAATANPFVGSIAAANKTRLDLEEEVVKAEEARDLANVEERYAAAVVDVFAPAGVRARRLDEATPYLNERTAHYLGALTDGKIEAYWTTLTETKNGKELREKFSVTVEKQGSAPSFKNLSGGEKRKVRLACALALQDLVANRASKSIEFWIGDEIDDALDGAGLERLMVVLEEKAKERGTVLVISHNDIAAYARRHMVVEKINDVSKVTLQ